MRHEHLTCSLMEVTAGYHPTALEFEDVAAAIGLDKTSVGRGTAVFDTNGKILDRRFNLACHYDPATASINPNEARWRRRPSLALGGRVGRWQVWSDGHQPNQRQDLRPTRPCGKADE
jgi:hypothetical protein